MKPIKIKFLELSFLLLVFAGCNEQRKLEKTDQYNSNTGYELKQSGQTSKQTYKDNFYCAEINYKSIAGSKISKYISRVTIIGDKLYSIHLPNRGWLNEKKIGSRDISSGKAKFKTVDGVYFEVKILGDYTHCEVNRIHTYEDGLLTEKEKAEIKESENTLRVEYEKEQNYFYLQEQYRRKMLQLSPKNEYFHYILFLNLLKKRNR